MGQSIIYKKKILFIGTGLYDYDEEIKKEFEKRGATVFYFSSNFPSTRKRIFDMIGLRFLGKRVMVLHITKLIEEQPDDIDFLFIIKGQYFVKSHIEQIKSKYKSCPTVLYQWDSINNLDNWILLRDNFDTILTFDRKDACDYNLVFRPLYYREVSTRTNVDITYDLSFVGISSPYRESVIHSLCEELDSSGVKYKIVIVKSKLRYFIERYVTHKISAKDSLLYSTSTVPYNDYIELALSSNVILDIPDVNQSGLTMRTIEAIGMGKKILTTNKDIINYDINNNCYKVWDVTSPNLDISFIKKRVSTKYYHDNYKQSSFIDDIISYFR